MVNLEWEQRKQCSLAFYDWFDGEENGEIREGRFWEAVEQRDDKQLFNWLIAAWRTGYEHGRNTD